jgi:N-acetylglucosamine kinase-like BadF-type ATPase
VTRPGVTRPVVLAVDGGNSKTDLALLESDGALLAHVRGPLSSPHHLGLDACVELLQGLLDDAVSAAGLDRNGSRVAEVAGFFLAGVDFPAEEKQFQDAVEARDWAARTIVGNDTFAVLRAGTARGWGVAVVCGAGINCVGVAPDGRQLRFPALGAITGDWGGGYDVGLAALSAAARSEDGRGPATSLERAVPAHFGLHTPFEVAEAIHAGRVANRRLIELAPVVFAEAANDAVAAEIVDRLATEIVALARVAITRLDLRREPLEVLLGGGLLRAGDGRLLGSIEQGLRELGEQIVVQRTASPPVVGAALFGLDALGAGEEAGARARAELAAAVDSDEELGLAERRNGDG